MLITDKQKLNIKISSFQFIVHHNQYYIAIIYTIAILKGNLACMVPCIPPLHLHVITLYTEGLCDRLRLHVLYTRNLKTYYSIEI